MRKRFDKLLKQMSCTAFDVAAAPMIIVAFGLPVLLIAVIVLMVVSAVRRIVKINKKGKEDPRIK